MDAGALHQLHNAGDENVRPVAHRVYLNFLALNVFVHQHRLVLVHLNGGFQVVAELLLVGHDLHGSAAQNKAGAHQHRVADLFGGFHAVFDVGDGPALGLGDVQLLQNLFKAVPVLRPLDGLAVRADDLYAPLHQRLGQIDGGLSAQGGNDAHRLFHQDNVHHVLGAEGLEIQLVGAGVVCGDGLRVVVDDNGLIARLLDGADGVDGGVVELYALADTDGAGTQDHYLFPVGHDRLVFLLIGGVEIGDVAFKLRGAGVDHLVYRHDALGDALFIDIQLAGIPEVRNGPVAEAHALRVGKHGHIPGMAAQLILFQNDVAQLLNEQQVDLGGVSDQAHVYALSQQLSNGVDPIVGALGHIAQQLVGLHVVEFLHVQVVYADLQRADGFQQALLNGAAHAHHLAGGLHLGAEPVVGGGELVKGEAGHFGDHIVKGRLKSGGGVGDGDLVQGHAHADLGGHSGDGVAAGLGGQSGGAGDAGVDLNQIVLEGVGVQSELDVAAALDLQRPDDPQGAVPQHVVFLVGQRLGGADHNGVTGMDAHRVDVLHVADGDGGVVCVPHHLVFDLLVALDALLDKHLMNRGQGQGVFHQFPELLLIVGKAAAGAAQGEGGAQHYRIADMLRRKQPFFHALGDLRGEHRLAQTLAQLLELLPVLRLLNAFAAGTQKLHLAFLQNALFLQLHGQVQAGLSADTGDDGVRAFIAQDLRDVFKGQRLHVHLVGDGGVGHDGGGVGVAEHYLVAFFFQGQAGLGPRVVEFRGLADDDGAGADHKDLVYIRSLRHFPWPPSSWQ